MASVGSVTFDSVEQEGLPPSERVESFTKPGADGTALRLGGKHGRPFTLICRKAVADVAAFTALLTSVENLKGAARTVTYSSGRTQTNVFLEEWDIRSRGDGRADENNSGPIAGGVGDAANCTYYAVLELRCIDGSTS